jgi:hypothetical protein
MGVRQRSKFIALLLIFGILLVPNTAGATTKGISVSPALKEVTLDADAADVTFSFGITNTTSETMNLRLSMLDFGSLNEAGGIAFLGRSGQETTTYGLRQWIVLEKDTLTLRPGESQELHATVVNRSALAPGGHYGAIVVTSEQEDIDDQSVAVLPSASVLVLLKKSGGEHIDLQLPRIVSPHSIIGLPREVSLRFRNDGNTHAVPRGTVKLQDPFKHIIGRGIINEDSGFILPESHRVYKVQFNSAPKGWMPGRYALITTWRYDGTEKTVTTVTHIWYIGLIPIIIFSIIMFIICLFFVQRRFRRKKTT